MNGFRIATPELLESTRLGKATYKVSGVARWDVQQRLMLMKPGDVGILCCLDISPQKREVQVISLDFDFEFNPVCVVATEDGTDEKLYCMDALGGENMRNFWEFTNEVHMMNWPGAKSTMGWRMISSSIETREL